MEITEFFAHRRNNSTDSKK